MADLIFDESFVRIVNGKSTFCGVLEDIWDDLVKKRHWKASETREQYISVFNRLLIPNLCAAPIDELSEDDYKNAIQSIQEKGKADEGLPYQEYEESTIKKFEYLLRVVVEEASFAEYCDNVLWGTFVDDVNLDPSDDNYQKKKKEKELLCLRKSLAAEEETGLQKTIFNANAKKGEMFGLMLMYVFGPRCQEACGASFGDFLRVEGFDSAFWQIKASVIPKTNQIQAGGKTPNMPRRLPCPTAVYDIIMKRKEYVLSTLECSDKDVVIEDYPVACAGQEYNKRLTAEQLNAFAKRVFSYVGINEKILFFLERELNEDNLALALKEKSLTAYLLRRNFATTLRYLGLSTSEIQYLMGHSIEDTYENRNDYGTPGFFNRISEKLNNRKFCYLPENEKKVTDIDLSYVNYGQVVYAESDKKTIIHKAQNQKIIIRIINKEPMNDLKIQCSATIKNVRIYSSKPNNDRTINILKEYEKTFIEENKT